MPVFLSSYFKKPNLGRVNIGSTFKFITKVLRVVDDLCPVYFARQIVGRSLFFPSLIREVVVGVRRYFNLVCNRK